MGVYTMQQKNILIIICDQLSATALSAYGNTYSSTPNLDGLAARSAVMEYAYTSCPLCQPARASFWTSRYPHQTGVLSNLPDQGFPAVSDDIPTLGELFSHAGYDCVHFGKTHDYGALRGFKVIESEEIHVPRTNPAIKFDYEKMCIRDRANFAPLWLILIPLGVGLMLLRRVLTGARKGKAKI